MITIEQENETKKTIDNLVAHDGEQGYARLAKHYMKELESSFGFADAVEMLSFRADYCFAKAERGGN